MNHDPEHAERREYDRRRSDEVEDRVAALEIRVVICETKISAMISTMNSRFDALDAGSKLLLEKLDRLDAIKERMVGAFVLLSLIGITGVVTWILAVAKILKVGP